MTFVRFISYNMDSFVSVLQFLSNDDLFAFRWTNKQCQNLFHSNHFISRYLYQRLYTAYKEQVEDNRISQKILTTHFFDVSLSMERIMNAYKKYKWEYDLMTELSFFPYSFVKDTKVYGLRTFHNSIVCMLLNWLVSFIHLLHMTVDENCSIHPNENDSLGYNLSDVAMAEICVKIQNNCNRNPVKIRITKRKLLFICDVYSYTVWDLTPAIIDIESNEVNFVGIFETCQQHRDLYAKIS